MNQQTEPLPSGHERNSDPADRTDWMDRPDRIEAPDPAAVGSADDTETAATAQAAPRWIKGPAPVTTLTGLLTVLIAAIALIRLTTDATLDWAFAVPVGAIVLGIASVVLGAVSFSRKARSAEHEPME